jgi:hypothetical protein
MSPEERRKLLKDANMTEKEFKEWQDAYENAKPSSDKKPSDLGNRGNNRGKNAKDGRVTQVEGTKKNEKISSGRGKAPPEYADLPIIGKEP